MIVHIDKLEINDVRNLSSVRLENLNRINIFFGDNGSGKTSILESLYLVGLGRSFRTRTIKSVIQHEKEQSVVFCNAKTEGAGLIPVGVLRTRRGATEVRISGRSVDSLAELAKLFPLQLINSDSFELLEGSPTIRRQFMDWGVFHVEHQFHRSWKNARKCLAHRNSLLRHGKMTADELNMWTKRFAVFSEAVDSARRRYLTFFEEVLQPLAPKISGIDDISIEYLRGWKETETLDSVLIDSTIRDQYRGYTTFGPHRADIKIKAKGRLASEWLSRGQEKLVICGLKLAQAMLFEKSTGRKCLFLIDDLPSELDGEHLGKICQLLSELGGQIFITCIDPAELGNKWRTEQHIGWFHVEHGEVNRVKNPILE